MSVHDVIIVGGGLAGLSAAIYLGRAKRDTLLIESGHSMAVWEPDVQNYLGFPEGVAGETLLERGHAQARRFEVDFADDEIGTITADSGVFRLRGRNQEYLTSRLLLATGLTHLPPDIPDVRSCLGRSLFFCKDCDGYRVQGARIAIIGTNNHAVEYALEMLMYSPTVIIATNGSKPTWDRAHAEWLAEYSIPAHLERIVTVEHDDGHIRTLCFDDGRQVLIDYVFAVRGDVYHNDLARQVGAALDDRGEICVDADMRTSVSRVYAAGCVTPANCQMIIAAGQGATAAQAINRELFEESLKTHALRRYRDTQLAYERTEPEVR